MECPEKWDIRLGSVWCTAEALGEASDGEGSEGPLVSFNLILRVIGGLEGFSGK